MLSPMRFVEVTLAAPAALVLQLDPFYTLALLVPGGRFDAAQAWADERFELLGGVFEFENWDARAVYFLDPAGNIVELIAHHRLEENGREGEFDAEEIVGFSELGLVG